MVEAHRDHASRALTSGELRGCPVDRNGFPRPSASVAMTVAPASVDIRRPPEGLRALTEWFDGVSLRLVLLEGYSLEEVREAIDRFSRSVERHVARAKHLDRPPDNGGLAGEHARFESSIEELRLLMGIVEREDHGGHRQALGQYGRIFAEALLRHLREESSLSGHGNPPAGGPAHRPE